MDSHAPKVTIGPMSKPLVQHTQVPIEEVFAESQQGQDKDEQRPSTGDPLADGSVSPGTISEHKHCPGDHSQTDSSGAAHFWKRWVDGLKSRDREDPPREDNDAGKDYNSRAQALGFVCGPISAHLQHFPGKSKVLAAIRTPKMPEPVDY